MSYARLHELKQYRGIGATTTTDDVLLQSFLDRATEAIQRYTGRRFEAETETRYYDEDAYDSETGMLWLDDDLLTITTLTNGDSSGTTISSTYYTLMPRNGSPPYYGIMLTQATSTVYNWEWDTDYWVSVLGTWGYSATPPPDVVQACIRWASHMYDQKDAAIYETTAFPESGIIALASGVPVDVKVLLDPYKVRLGR